MNSFALTDKKIITHSINGNQLKSSVSSFINSQGVCNFLKNKEKIMVLWEVR